MKKISRIIVSFAGIIPAVAFGAVSSVTLPNPTKVPTLYDFVREILTIVVKIGIPIATIFIIWSGFLFLTAQGDETQLKKAKQSFVWACVGTAVLLGAWLLATAIKSTIDQL
jgi:hypothetical protein